MTVLLVVTGFDWYEHTFFNLFVTGRYDVFSSEVQNVYLVTNLRAKTKKSYIYGFPY